MPIYLIIIICLISAAALFCVAMLCFAAIVYKKAFGTRFDKNPLLKYFSAEDFSLSAEPVHTFAGKTRLCGYIYSDRRLEECERLVLFAHGMGPGHCAYTTEIAYFCKKGCAVLAFDCEGCNLSEGKSFGGLENSTRCLVAAYKFAKSQPRLKNLPVALVGHSMGGYAALCASAFVKADSVVAFSAPESPVKILTYLASAVLSKPFVAMLAPFLKLLSFFRYAEYANLRASESALKGGARTLIFHGDKDGIVPLEFSAYAALEGSGASRVLCKGKGHNPYNTFNAERLLNDLADGLKISADMTAEKRDKFFSSLDYKAICEEDESVMRAAINFINGKF